LPNIIVIGITTIMVIGMVAVIMDITTIIIGMIVQKL
jgi:hypothetical protein